MYMVNIVEVLARFQLLHMPKGLESLDFGGGRTKQKGIFHFG